MNSPVIHPACPKCHAPTPPGATECPSCGVLLSKVRSAQPATRVEAKPATARQPGSAIRLTFVALGVVALVDAAMILDKAEGVLHQLAGLSMVLAAAVLFVGAGVVHMLGVLAGRIGQVQS